VEITKEISGGARSPSFRIPTRQNHVDEKLLLYGGAVATRRLRHRAQKSARDDERLVELEKKRGISISSTVLQFTTMAIASTCSTTPGQRIFPEDTYRVLTAVDAG